MSFISGFKKIADAPGSPQIDPVKAKQMQDSANQSGWQPKQWWSNLKGAVGSNSNSVGRAPSVGTSG